MDSPGAVAHVARTVLEVPGPFDGGGVIRFLSWHAVTGAEEGDATSFTQSARLAHGAGTVTVRLLEAEPGDVGGARVEVTTRVERAADAGELLAGTRRLLGLDVDAARIDADLARDPALAAVVRATPGLRIPGTLDPRSTLFRTIVGQQISVASARATHGRMTADLGEDLPASVAHGSVTRLPPTAARIARDGGELLRGPARRTATLIRIAEALETGELVIEPGVPRAELRAALVAFHGVGPWTADYVAMRALGEPDILLSGDLIVRRGGAALGLPDEARALDARAAAWSPWRSYATLHLWRVMTDGMPAAG
ncbi:DNA-3-methyladenine glycosylase family protein [Clavibacter michiganensis]|uniref:DNA-3-methyladenine glycosylase family protein n=1 Tax=Clavibacter michiganensis TaxID=28447 RepID=UPI00136631D3|nr:DNA-3-methyladenine glycosylase 2 family protein [Clavibacter michiganensis]MWJ04449.1 DNA-3-methyladenine glycosylase 2 family protein [Clavibacter michiganensis subsp. michiganensis]MWJ10894.1 DNA-3-methyladenine glycosylase 2 family protein [Clavibacter michiganensis subsp. michiganensis]MWJ22821.1 DNA-3-methyladenine glycosylase 2 family protein [Clavibacter michiganensis subsp. michiganensis]MWJ45892.1 DNA-3-methyladenine glycosylase 2 family protein [Clavibacter michiganensis subsp. mi